jgi:hypothetical protein
LKTFVSGNLHSQQHEVSGMRAGLCQVCK